MVYMLYMHAFIHIHMCLGTGVHTEVCACMWRSNVDVQSVSLYLIHRGQISQWNSNPTSMTKLARQPAPGIPLSTFRVLQL